MYLLLFMTSNENCLNITRTLKTRGTGSDSKKCFKIAIYLVDAFETGGNFYYDFFCFINNKSPPYLKLSLGLGNS